MQRIVRIALLGALLALLPFGARLTHASRTLDVTAATQKAVILEPFATELHVTADTDKPEYDALTSAGFHVDEFFDDQVTVDLMENLGQYSVVYLRTHSDPYGDGDAVVSTGDKDYQKWAKFLPDYSGTGCCDGSLVQILGDGAEGTYLAITAKFVKLHMNAFPNNALIFINGCNLYSTPKFWNALQGNNAATLITWDDHILSNYTSPAADFVFRQLVTGKSVGDALTAAEGAGVASGVTETGAPSHLKVLGDSGDTLARALSGT